MSQQNVCLSGTTNEWLTKIFRWKQVLQKVIIQSLRLHRNGFTATRIFSFQSFEYLIDYCLMSSRGWGWGVGVTYNEHKSHTSMWDLDIHGAHYNNEKCSQYNVYILANWSWRYLHCQRAELRPWHFQREQSLNLILDLFGGVVQCFKELHDEWLSLKAEGPWYHWTPQPWLI